MLLGQMKQEFGNRKQHDEKTEVVLSQCLQGSQELSVYLHGVCVFYVCTTKVKNPVEYIRFNQTIGV